MKNSPCSVARGFTLIELMVTIAIAAILMAVAAPSFTSFQRNSQLTTSTNDLVAAISSARSEAMRFGRRAAIVAATGGWQAGWTVCVDLNWDSACTDAADRIVVRGAEAPSYLTTSGDGPGGAAAPYVLFDESGYARVSGSAGGFQASTITVARTDVTGTAALAQTRRIKVSSGGRIRVCTPSSATDATCTATGD